MIHLALLDIAHVDGIVTPEVLLEEVDVDRLTMVDQPRKSMVFLFYLENPFQTSKNDIYQHAKAQSLIFFY